MTVMSPISERPLFNLSRAGRALGVDRSTVRRWIDAGYLHAVRVGSRSYIPADEVERVRREGGLFHS